MEYWVSLCGSTVHKSGVVWLRRRHSQSRLQRHGELMSSRSGWAMAVVINCDGLLEVFATKIDEANHSMGFINNIYLMITYFINSIPSWTWYTAIDIIYPNGLMMLLIIVTFTCSGRPSSRMGLDFCLVGDITCDTNAHVEYVCFQLGQLHLCQTKSNFLRGLKTNKCRHHLVPSWCVFVKQYSDYSPVHRLSTNMFD